MRWLSGLRTTSPVQATNVSPRCFAALRRAVMSRSDAERSLKEAVLAARDRGYSWRTIGSLVGTSGEAARQRYGSRETV